MKYRKKPVVIEAHVWDGDWEELRNWADRASDGAGTSIHYCEKNNTSYIYIRTLEGRVDAPVGNYVICGVNGEFYSCDPEIFNKSYELVENE